MSRVIKLLKKAAEKRENLASRQEPSFQDLKVSDIRRKLFEKIKERQSSPGKKSPIDLPGVTEKTETFQPTKSESTEILAEKLQDEYESKIRALELENKKLTKLQKEALKEGDYFRADIEAKSKVIDGFKLKPDEDQVMLKKEYEKAVANIESLRSKLYASGKETKEHLERISQLEDILKNREKRLVDSDKHYKKIETEKGEIGAKLKNAESSVKTLEAEASGLRSNIEDKEKKLAESGKQFNKNLELAKKEVLLHLQAADRENKTLESKVAQLGAELEAKNKRISESEGSYRELEDSLKEDALKLETIKSKNNDLEEEVAGLRVDLEIAEKKLAESDKLYKETELAGKDLALQLKALEREKKALDGKIAQLNIEIEAKNNRIGQSEKAYKELDSVVKDASLKAEAAEARAGEIEDKIAQIILDTEEIEKKHSSEMTRAGEDISNLKSETENLNNLIAGKEKAENELKDNISRLESEIEARDKKIQADIKYCEGIVREVSDLRQKMKALRLKVR